MNRVDLLSELKQKEARLKSPLRQFFGVAWANLKLFLSYKSWFVMEMLAMIASAVMYYFVGLQVDPITLEQSGWGTNYLIFSLVGIATSHYLWRCLTNLSHAIQNEIQWGTLETVSVSPVSMITFFMGQMVSGYLISIIYLIGLFTVGIVGLGAKVIVTPASIMTFLFLFILMLVVNQSLGFIAAGIIMVYKRGDPVTYIVASLNDFLAGVLYPLKVLETFPILQVISMALPYTYALDGMRRAIIFGASAVDANVLTDIIVLLVFSVALIPLGLKVLSWGYRTIRMNGTTSSY